MLEPRPRRPTTSPSKLTDEVKARAVAVRAALEASGLDHGPISVHDKMRAMGLNQVPSTASLTWIFREAGVARVEPKKKPRSAWRRFVYPSSNVYWQFDASEYVLSGGRKCVIFQLIDDHSRYAVASHVASSENSKAVITGKPYTPTTQGKNERLHQTLFRYLDKQPIAESLAELQAQVDQVRLHLQHRASARRAARARHAPDRVGSHSQSRVVSQVLGTERAHLNPVREALRADDAALHRRLLSIRKEAGLPEEISALRVFDVIAWMDGKRRGLEERSDLER
nr:integrase, catalytic region [Rhodococcus sp. JVH1]